MFKSLVKKFKEILSRIQNKEVLRENLRRNFILKEGNEKVDSDFVNAKIQSMKDSQGVSHFSGSGYNGPGNVDHDKITSNKNRHDFHRI